LADVVARVHVGVRYPHEVLAGLLFGVLVAWSGVRVEVSRPWDTEDRS
jgi:hypothetical protein